MAEEKNSSANSNEEFDFIDEAFEKEKHDLHAYYESFKN